MATLIIREVKEVDNKRCHFFAGIGGWELALQLARLKGYGNAIVPQLAAEFISAVMESI
jgi:hypothetical protein